MLWACRGCNPHTCREHWMNKTCLHMQVAAAGCQLGLLLQAHLAVQEEAVLAALLQCHAVAQVQVLCNQLSNACACLASTQEQHAVLLEGLSCGAGC